MKGLNETIKSTYGNDVCIRKRVPVSGGDINSAYALELSDGNRIFRKSNRKENADFFYLDNYAKNVIGCTRDELIAPYIAE